MWRTWSVYYETVVTSASICFTEVFLDVTWQLYYVKVHANCRVCIYCVIIRGPWMVHCVPWLMPEQTSVVKSWKTPWSTISSPLICHIIHHIQPFLFSFMCNLIILKPDYNSNFVRINTFFFHISVHLTINLFECLQFIQTDM